MIEMIDKTCRICCNDCGCIISDKTNKDFRIRGYTYCYDCGEHSSKEEIGNRIMYRIRHQLKIHWKWLNKEKDYNDVADFICNCINQQLGVKEIKK